MHDEGNDGNVIAGCTCLLTRHIVEDIRETWEEVRPWPPTSLLLHLMSILDLKALGLFVVRP